MILELRLLRGAAQLKSVTLDKLLEARIMDARLGKSEEEAVRDGMVADNVSTSDVHISDVIEVIETDEMFGEAGSSSGAVAGSIAATAGRRPRAYVKILEQPASKALRFRYECEGRSAGSIPGVSSTPENKTFPSIQIVGHSGRAVVVVSCVTKDSPYRPHPHNLVGKEGCSRGVCTLKMNSDTISFSNLGIQCVKKKDIEEALRVREEIRVDPFRTGFTHRSQPSSIDLNSVRLCFQVFLEGPQKDEFTIPLRPVVSEPIYDKKAMSDLTICKLSECSASVAGGKEVILLCEKVAKEDIQVRFYEEVEGDVVWESQGDFQPTHVHKQVAITFRTPKYRDIDCDKPVKAFVQLRRPSDGATSDPLPFLFIPLDAGRPAFWTLRRALAKKGDYGTFNEILNGEPIKRKLAEPLDEDRNNNNSISSNKKQKDCLISDPMFVKRKRHKYGGETSPQSMLRASHDDDSRSTFVGSVSPDHHMLQVKREPGERSSPTPYATYGGNLSPIYHPGAVSPGPSSPHKTPSPVPPSHFAPFASPPHGSHLFPTTANQFNVALQTGGGLVKTSSVDFQNMFHDGSSTAPTGGNTLNNLNSGGLFEHQQLANPNISLNLKATTTVATPISNNTASKSNHLDERTNTVLDMDSQQYSLELNLGNLDSAELARMAMYTDANLSENLSSNLTLSDSVNDQRSQDQTMNTDSFTRVAANAIQELVSMGTTAPSGLFHHHPSNMHHPPSQQ